MGTMERNDAVRKASWAAVILAVAGALLLYPIGMPVFDAIFVLTKICMVGGLLLLIFSGRKAGFVLWAAASVVAVAMTIAKWVLAPDAGIFAVILYLGSMVVDLGMPLLVHRLATRQYPARQAVSVRGLLGGKASCCHRAGDDACLQEVDRQERRDACCEGSGRIEMGNHHELGPAEEIDDSRHRHH